MMWFRLGLTFVGRSKDGCWEPSVVVGMACGNSSSKVSLLQEVLAAVSNFSWIPGFVLQYAVALPKSMMILCFIRKSQPKMTGVGRLSSTMKVCSTCRFPRLNDIRDVPQGKMCLPSALTSWTPCKDCKSYLYCKSQNRKLLSPAKLKPGDYWFQWP